MLRQMIFPPLDPVARRVEYFQPFRLRTRSPELDTLVQGGSGRFPQQHSTIPPSSKPMDLQKKTGCTAKIRLLHSGGQRENETRRD